MLKRKKRRDVTTNDDCSGRAFCARTFSSFLLLRSQLGWMRKGAKAGMLGQEMGGGCIGKQVRALNCVGSSQPANHSTVFSPTPTTLTHSGTFSGFPSFLLPSSFPRASFSDLRLPARRSMQHTVWYCYNCARSSSSPEGSSPSPRGRINFSNNIV